MRVCSNLRQFGGVILLLLVGGLLPSERVSAQSFYITGGDLLSSDATSASGAHHQAGVHVGGRLWLTDLFQLQGGLTYQDLLSAEASLLIRPFSDSDFLEPYALVGIGGFFDKAGDRRVVPIGLGVEYHVNRTLGILFEVTGRWTRRHENKYADALDFGVMPSVGVIYRLRRTVPKAPPPRPPVTPRPEPVFTEATAEPVPAPIQSFTRTVFEPTPQERFFVVPRRADTLRLKVQDGMVRVPDGTFILGLTDEDPLQLQTAGLRRITLSGYYVDQYEVTNADYLRYLREIPADQRARALPDTMMSQSSGNRFSWTEYLRGPAYGDHPVVGVAFEQAASYCAFYNKRLPTETEWEYAARSGMIGGVYPWNGLEPRDAQGNFLANYNPGRGGYAADGYAFTAPVNAFPPSSWNLFNMSGNVAEWCQDTFHPSYSTLSDFNPLNEDPNETRRVVRGGSWASDAFYIGVGVRDAQPADEASPYVGFRCVMDISALEEATDEQGQ